MKRRAALVGAGMAGGAVAVLVAEWLAVVALVRRRMWG
jgi:hypothetical protein